MRAGLEQWLLTGCGLWIMAMLRKALGPALAQWQRQALARSSDTRTVFLQISWNASLHHQAGHLPAGAG